MVTIKLKFKKSLKSREVGHCIIQLTCQRKTRMISTGIQLKVTEWDFPKSCVNLKNVSLQRGKELIQIQDILQDKITTLEKIVNDFKVKGQKFTISTIVGIYQYYGVEKNFFSLMEKRISNLKQNGQIRTASNYRNAMHMFMTFCGNDNIPVSRITSCFIKQFESFLIAKGNSLNTISFYMRILRATYNYAVEQDWIEKHQSPFKNVYTGCERTVKRSVNVDVIRLLRRLDLTGFPNLEFARDMFLFSFYMLGMAFVDVAHLERKNLREEVLEYRRRKTKQTLQIFLPDCAKRIIEKYSKQNPEGTFLFPILDKKYEKSYPNALRKYNRNLKKLALMIGTKDMLTSYVARHTWATLAKKQGVPTYVISEALGHTSEKTTRIYLDSIDNNLIYSANKKVISLLTEDE